MARDKTFHDYVLYDLMGGIPGITSKAMFGGSGLYNGGIIFGIIVEGELYFKVGDSNRALFEKMNSHPFVYSKSDGKPITMSYWLVPEEVMEDQEQLVDLMIKSMAVARKYKDVRAGRFPILTLNALLDSKRKVLYFTI